MYRFAYLALLLSFLVAAGIQQPASAATTHSWVGADPKSPNDWKKAKNWDTEKIPANGDSVHIKAARVENVPDDRHFDTVTIEADASLGSGGPLSVDNLEMFCARLAIGATIAKSAYVRGGELRPSEGKIDFTSVSNMTVRKPTLVEPGCGNDANIEAGILKVFPGATIINTGVLRGDGGTILGMVCCTKPQVVENRNTGIIDATDTLTLKNLRLLNKKGKISGGLLTLDGGDHVLQDRTRFGAVAVFADGATVRIGDTTSSGTGSLTLGPGSTFNLTGGADLVGIGEWLGEGALVLQEGGIHGTQTVSPDTTFRLSGPWFKAIEPYSRRDAGEVIVEGTAEFGTGTTHIGGRIVIKGTLDVAKGQEPRLRGRTCCTAPIPELVLEGTAKLGERAHLTIEAMRLATRSTINGPGELVLKGGDHAFSEGAVFDAPVRAIDGAVMRTSGDVKVERSFEQAEGSALIGGKANTAFVTGSGSWTWVSGDISGKVQFGAHLDVTVKGNSLKQLATPTKLGVAGPLRIEGPGQFRLAPGGTLRTTGPVTLAGARVLGSNCCTNPATFEATDSVTVETAAGFSSLNSLETRFEGQVDLNGGVLEIDSLDPVFRPGSELQLEGGTLRAEGLVLFQRNARLAGPGTVIGNVTLQTATTTFDTRGRLVVRGEYEQDADSLLEIRFASGSRDSLEVDGAVSLAGRIVFSGAFASITRPLTVVKGTSLETGFLLVRGLPASKAAFFGPRKIVVGPR